MKNHVKAINMRDFYFDENKKHKQKLNNLAFNLEPKQGKFISLVRKIKLMQQVA
jgi:hypothetical protein